MFEDEHYLIRGSDDAWFGWIGWNDVLDQYHVLLYHEGQGHWVRGRGDIFALKHCNIKYILSRAFNDVNVLFNYSPNA